MAQENTVDILAAALDVAKRWPIFPCWPQDETPGSFVQRTKHLPPEDIKKLRPAKAKSPLIGKGVYGATKDPGQIRSWWARWPDAMIGVPTGKVIGLFVLDIDWPNGPTSLEALESVYGKLPETVEQSTGGGGKQKFFLCPDDGRTISNTVGTIGENLDTRGDGGYVIVAPSIHPSGFPYKWEKTPLTTGTQFAEAPGWLLGMVAKREAEPSGCVAEPDKENYVVAATKYASKDAPLAVEGAGGNATTLKVAMYMRDLGVSEETCLELLLEFWNDRCSPPWDVEDLAKIVRNAYKYAQNKGIGAKTDEAIAQAAGTAFADAWEPVLPVDDFGDSLKPIKAPPPAIRLLGGKISTVVMQVEAALMHPNVPYRNTMYQRGSSLVRVCRLEEGGTKRGIVRPAGVVTLEKVTSDFLYQAIATHVQFLKMDMRKSEDKRTWSACDPPKNLPDLILARSGSWPFPTLRGVLACPTIRPDGSLLLNPGYDEASGYFMAHNLNVFVKNDATRADAKASLEKIHGLLAGFAFVDDTDRAVAVSLLLTAVMRAAMNTAPLITITATTRGSGKTTLGDTAAVLATGRPCPAMAATTDRLELEKRLIASLLAGDAIVNLDNINGDLGSDLLSQATTGTSMKIRPLGSSKPVEIPNTALWIANGNNMRVSGDLSRRTLKCRMDPGVERPEMREFAFNPIHEAGKRREEFLGACLTIAHAYIKSGSPSIGKPPLGSFEEWSALVRNPIVWAGEADPCDSYEHVIEEDTEAENLGALLEAWQACFGDERRTVKEAIDVGYPEGLEDAGAALQEAIEAVTANARDVKKSLGLFVSKNRGRIIGGKKFEKAGVYKGIVNWKVVKA